MAAPAKAWLAAIQGATRLGIKGVQSDNEQRQITVINTAYLLIILPIWLLLSSSYLIAARWSAGLVMAAGVIALSALVILHSHEKLGLRTYGQWSLLSQREWDVLMELGQGKSNAEIAEALFLSQETIKSHIKALLQKLKAKDRTHAVVIAFQQGWLH